MKTSPYMATIFIILIGLFVITTGQAGTPECNSGKVVALVADNTKSAGCPPALVCEKGYIPGCVKDDIMIPPPVGEQQQYPSEAAENWVQSVVSGILVNIALNDPRWGSREEGEVFARENNDFIVWYWPKGGVATFDPTNLGRQARWHDYRLSQIGGVPRSGTLNLYAGMAIHFHDGGNGGVSIFEKAEDTPPVDGDFLSNYTNPKREEISAHRIYPIGQKMLLSAWNPGNVGDVQMLHDNGFTTIGPFENAWPTANKNLKAMYQKAKDIGMRAWTFMHAGTDGGMVYKVCNALKAGKTHAQIMQGMVSLWGGHYSKEPYNSITDAFVLLPEELASRLNTCDTSKLLAYDNAVIDKIKLLTGGARPIIRTEVEGNSASNIARANSRVGVAAQHYFEKHGQSDEYKQAAIIQVRARGYLAYMANLDRNHPIEYTRPRIVLPGMIYEPTDKSVAASEKYAGYYIWTNAIQGINGFSLYKMDKNVAGGNLEHAFIKTIKRFTYYGFDQAFLWGDRAPGMPLTIVRTSGPSNANWTQGSTTYRAESMLAADIQFGNERFIAITNSHWDQSIGVRISGLPVGDYKIIDVKTGQAESIANTSKTISIEPLGVRMYKVSK